MCCHYFCGNSRVKKLINILLILVLLVTTLPIKQVGNMLYNNQWTEELNEHSEHQVEKKMQLAKWAFLTGADLFSCNENGVEKQDSRYFSYCQKLPTHPSGDIHSPPPNFLQ